MNSKRRVGPCQNGYGFLGIMPAGHSAFLGNFQLWLNAVRASRLAAKMALILSLAPKSKYLIA
jgi:hypothetical protein